MDVLWIADVVNIRRVGYGSSLCATLLSHQSEVLNITFTYFCLADYAFVGCSFLTWLIHMKWFINFWHEVSKYPNKRKYIHQNLKRPNLNIELSWFGQVRLSAYLCENYTHSFWDISTSLGWQMRCCIWKILCPNRLVKNHYGYIFTILQIWNFGQNSIKKQLRVWNFVLYVNVNAGTNIESENRRDRRTTSARIWFSTRVNSS